MSTENLNLTVHDRKKTGKSPAHRTRVQGLVPGIVYGPKMKTPINVAVDRKSLRRLYLKSGKTGLVSLNADEKSSNGLKDAKVLIKAVQTDPVKNTIIHVDFNQIDITQKMRVTVPLNFTGKPAGLTEGGILSIAARSVEIRALPTEIPSEIDVDVSSLNLNESIHLSELAKNITKFEFVFENDIVLALVAQAGSDEKSSAPEEEETPEAAAASAASAEATPEAPKK